jgi:hypothetical protein
MTRAQLEVINYCRPLYRAHATLASIMAAAASEDQRTSDHGGSLVSAVVSTTATRTRVLIPSQQPSGGDSPKVQGGVALTVRGSQSMSTRRVLAHNATVAAVAAVAAAAGGGGGSVAGTPGRLVEDDVSEPVDTRNMISPTNMSTLAGGSGMTMAASSSGAGGCTTPTGSQHPQTPIREDTSPLPPPTSAMVAMSLPGAVYISNTNPSTPTNVQQRGSPSGARARLNLSTEPLSSGGVGTSTAPNTIPVASSSPVARGAPSSATSSFNLAQLVNNPILLELLKDAASERHCVEMVMMYIDVVKYKRTSDARLRRQLGRAIYTTYIGSTALHEVNLGSTLVRQLQHSIGRDGEGDRYEENTFDDAQRELTSLIRQNLLTSFTTNPLYIEIIAAQKAVAAAAASAAIATNASPPTGESNAATGDAMNAMIVGSIINGSVVGAAGDINSIQNSRLPGGDGHGPTALIN